jgi:uncharacterized protein (TIGR00255 family)
MSEEKGSSIHSMTGYASRRVDADERVSFTMSLKSVNHRFFDLQLRLPQGCDALEGQLRRVLKEQIQRGHVEFSLTLERQTRTGLYFSDEQIGAYIAAFRESAERHHLECEPDLNEVLRMPGMMTSTQSNSRDEAALLEAPVMAELTELIAGFNAVRAEEGAALVAELRGSMDRLDAAAVEVAGLREGVRAANYERLRARIAELTDGLGVSEDRLLSEAALIADRSDVEEELVRLRTHVASLLAMLDAGGPVGKRLDFLLQELNREANTLLSKTSGATAQNGLRITDLVLEMKVEIERAREQIQNLE